ncbi:DnaD domain-containing protein [Aquibacillus saliphilus]|uniref:DnaD domain-containing protein n=1 Tax=Aquibacillus saliphilus TaxID=1909422 RepID=UPI001CF0914E|nr:DnaD domain-containing protein [Aquibacillus saliphilus]
MTNKFDFQSFMKDQLVIPAMLLQNYTKYNLNEQEVMLIIQIHRFQMAGNSFPTPTELANYMTLTDQECAAILRKLIQKNILSIDQAHSDKNVLNESYSLESLWEKLYSDKPTENEPTQQPEMNIFILFEQEFGRPLSPLEIETVNIWIDQEEQPPSLIKAALREAVLMGKLNFRYIDRILREWKRKGIRSVEQARNHSKPFHANQANNQPSNQEPKRDVSLYYNWLEEE